MKNWMKGLAMGMIVFSLAACSEPAEPKTDAETGEKVEVEKESKMTAQEVYDKAMLVSKDQKSMHAKMDIEQKIEIPSQDLNIDSTTKMDMDMVVEPLAMYQKMKMDMGEQGSMETETYATDEGFYMYEPQNKQWLKMPSDMSGDMMAQMSGGADPALDMSIFKDVADEFKFEQTNDEYILTLKASGEKFSELFKKIASENLPAEMDFGEAGADVLENMDVKSLNYEIFIDKKTFYTNAFNMDMDMTLSVEGEEMHVIQKMKAIVSKINEIDEIKIPQDVLDNAVDINDMMNE